MSSGPTRETVCANLFFGKSKDGLKWKIGPDPIEWVDEKGKPNPISYGYDPRIVEIDGIYYIVWCDDMHGASITGLGRTTDFKTFIRMPNPLMPFNRNGVLFPRKVNGKYLLLSRPSDSTHYAFRRYLYERKSGPDLLGQSQTRNEQGRKRLVAGHKNRAGPTPIETTERYFCSITAYHLHATALFTALAR